MESCFDQHKNILVNFQVIFQFSKFQGLPLLELFFFLKKEFLISFKKLVSLIIFLIEIFLIEFNLNYEDFFKCLFLFL